MKLVIGIDPGLIGAFTIWSMEHNNIVIAAIFKIETKPYGKGNQIDARYFSNSINYLAKPGNEVSAYIERVSAMPGQGVTSMFGFGRSVGVIEGVIMAFGWPIAYPTPNEWKKHHSIQGKDKAASLSMFGAMEPSYSLEHLSKEKRIGIADSYLIARYGAWRIKNA